MQQSPAVNSKTLYCLQRKKMLQLNIALCAVHHNDSHKKLRARGIPPTTSEREAYVY